MDAHQEQDVPIFNDGIVDIPGNEASFKSSLFLFPTIKKLKPTIFVTSFFFISRFFLIMGFPKEEGELHIVLRKTIIQ